MENDHKYLHTLMEIMEKGTYNLLYYYDTRFDRFTLYLTWYLTKKSKLSTLNKICTQKKAPKNQMYLCRDCSCKLTIIFL